MRIGLYVSAVGCDSMDEVLARFGAAEAAGFHTAWSGQIFAHDLLTLLALAGRATRRIELGAWVVPTPTRHPAALAQHVITTQHACGGRLALGLGVSHGGVIRRRFGIDDPRPRSRLAEVLAVLAPLLRGEAVRHEGSFHRTALQLDRLGAAPRLPARAGARGRDASRRGRARGRRGAARARARRPGRDGRHRLQRRAHSRRGRPRRPAPHARLAGRSRGQRAALTLDS